jgi:hypothetical protein
MPDDAGSSSRLADVLKAAALDAPGVVERRSGEGGREFLTADRAFAVLDPDGRAASFRLATVVAAAAVRTPDVVASMRGDGWVTIRPANLDGHAVDRVTAWFESARRLASGV